MKEFDYIIIGGGCAGLSLAYEMDINQKLKDKTLARFEPTKPFIPVINTFLFFQYSFFFIFSNTLFKSFNFFLSYK